MALSHASPLSAVIHSDEAKECRRWRHKIHTYSHGGRGTHCLANDDVDGVDDPGQVTQDCQHETNPELTLKAILEEDPQRRQDDGQQHINERVSAS